MDKIEKLDAIKNRVKEMIDSMNGKYDHISEMNYEIQDFKTYFSHKHEKKNTYINNAFIDKIEIVTYDTLMYIGPTLVDSYTLQYESLTERDLETFYKGLICRE